MIFHSEFRPPVLSEIVWYIDTIIQFLLTDESPKRSYPVIVGHHVVTQGSPVIYYNTEMLTVQSSLNSVLQRCQMSYIAEIWDYSLENIKILKKHGISARHVPIKLVGRPLEKIREFLKAEKVYDVGFCGGLSPRRTKILEELNQKGVKVRIISNKSGEERDKELAKCKIILNIHYFEEHNIFESVRCAIWLDAGVPCISESSLDNDPRCHNVPYSNIVAMTIQLLGEINARN